MNTITIKKEDFDKRFSWAKDLYGSNWTSIILSMFYKHKVDVIIN